MSAVGELHRMRAKRGEVLRADDSFAKSLRNLTTLGLYVDEEQEGTRVQDVQRRWAVAVLRAVSIAIETEPTAESYTDVEFDGSDAATVLAGVIAVLEDGFEVDREVRTADADAEQAEGGAS